MTCAQPAMSPALPQTNTLQSILCNAFYLEVTLVRPIYSAIYTYWNTVYMPNILQKNPFKVENIRVKFETDRNLNIYHK